MDNLYSKEINFLNMQINCDRELEADRDYLLSMYPAKAKIILVMIQEECDKLEYEGSPMLILFPDKQTVLDIAGSIYSKVSYDDNEDLKHMIEILVCNEFMIRRSRYKRRRHFF